MSVNELASVHGKDVERLMNEMLTTKSDFGKDNLKYVNKEIAMQWLGIAPPEGAASLTDTQQSIANIIQNFENPKGSAKFSLITPEMDAAYLSAVERGDMATAQQMVMEVAKLAMPNTKVVDENGNPKVVYHGDRKKSRYIFSTDTFFTPDATYAKRYTNGTGEVYATYLDIKKPFDIRDKKAYDIFVEFRGGRTPVETTTGAMDWAEYSYEDLQEFVEETAPNEYDGFIMDEGADPDGNGGIKHRGLSYVPFASNQIKSADPVTYDDNGNVIPLSERFNPEKEDIRYSLSDRPTGLLTDFAEEFEALQREYTSLDPTAIHAQHPFRIRKRKVVQKYLNHVTEVLGNNVENIVYDKTNNAHIKRVYDRIVAANGTFKNDVSFIEFKEYLQSQPVKAAFIKGTNIIVYNISTDNRNNSQVDILNSYVHENVHRIIEKLGIDSKTLEDILDEGLSLLPNITNAYIDGYQSCPKFEQGEETLAYSIGDRMSPPKIGMRLLRVIEGYITFEEFNATQKKLLPLRDSYIEKILNELQNEYKARKEGADYKAESANRGGVNGEDKGEAKKVYDRRWRGYSETNGYTRRSVLDEERAEILSNANAKQKTPNANIDNDLYTFDEARFSLRDDIDARIAKKRPDILPEERMEAVEYIMSRGDMGCVEVINWGAQRNRANDTSQIVLVVSLSQKKDCPSGQSFECRYMCG